jgi:RNA-binding protein
LKGKEKRFLRGIGVTLDPVMQIGKGGITPHVVTQAEGALRTRELIKGRVLDTAPRAAAETAEELASRTGAELVQVIGRTFLLYKRNDKEPKIEFPV